MAYIASDIKGMNRKIVYDLFLTKNEMSKSEISRVTGISAPTVMKIIDYLEEIGCVREIGEGESSIGRKPSMLQFDPSSGYALGVDFSGVETKIGIVDFGYHICGLETVLSASTLKEALNNDFLLRVRSFVEKTGIPYHKIRGICIGLPGVINPASKTMELAPLVGIMEQQSYSDIAGRISDALQMPAIFENDANAAAIGEFVSRKYTSADDLLYITVGKGIGAGIILNGNLRRGNRSFAGELGYMVFSKKYQSKPDQAGWLEQEIGPDYLSRSDAINQDSFDHLASTLALAIVNICVPLEIGHVVLGKFKDKIFHRLLLKRINYYLDSLSALEIRCEAPRCEAPAVLGGAHLIVESVLGDLLGT